MTFENLHIQQNFEASKPGGILAGENETLPDGHHNVEPLAKGQDHDEASKLDKVETLADLQ